jgi:hypothetical protein
MTTFEMMWLGGPFVMLLFGGAIWLLAKRDINRWRRSVRK